MPANVEAEIYYIPGRECLLRNCIHVGPSPPLPSWSPSHLPLLLNSTQYYYTTPFTVGHWRPGLGPTFGRDLLPGVLLVSEPTSEQSFATCALATYFKGGAVFETYFE